ncbi:MAG: 2,3-bisphosphoglycerate-independent phosphoglycerate mutase [Christensenella sp.]|uniref:2,3-bisphosphoglycerate-independent phosphoglycerate mutase n=1 Tax=Christensenella sp. TaxID=1935934 RepID=UPI002B1F9B3F|nr:2,3-bisphosphoglycerate-independent phosphoglycerate mutase [Christensenella sp.]MEA5002321.1 2,3-bisphosphoglycerate-independent phosphoglycerate mutase [Christensenella sp.]
MAFTALIIMDGFGLDACNAGNAICAEGTPNLNKLMEEYPHTSLGASGMSVGLPDGQMGNSEVGHLNIGAGRIVYQELTRITKSIADGDFFSKKEFMDAVENVKKHGGALHLLGLISSGGVHSHQEHLYALLRLAKENGIGDKTFIHCLMDGRDVAPDSGKGFIEQLEAKIKEIGAGRIATVMGRYYAMDRDNRWERVKLAYDAIVRGEGLNAPDAVSAMQDSYDKKEYDEFVKPTVITQNGEPVAKLKKDDSVIFFNFRPDRAREITRTIIDEDFTGFDRDYFPTCFVSMTQYDKTFKNVHVAYKPQVLENTLGEYLAKNNKKQFRIAETEKYAHVTFFFNGGVEQPNEGEDRYLIPSPKVATYDLQPEMSAPEVCKQAVEKIKSQKYDVMVLNFANCDMVGHTGIMEAAVAAVQAVDECVKEVVDAILSVGGDVLITADHGNAEIMIDPVTGGPFTAHSTNPVPCILVSKAHQADSLRDGGILADLAPTMLDLMGLPQPVEMEGKSLIKK